MDAKKQCLLQLVDALVECKTLAEKAGRDLCVALLDDPIPSKAPRHDDRGADVLSIVSTCLEYEGGIDSLVTAVEAREGNAVTMPRVRQCADALKRAMNPPPPPPSPPPPSQAGYVLSIGISKYFHVDKKQNNPAPNEFPDLSFAANDAKAFHEFLRERGYRGPEPLTDDQATLRGIMRALDKLRRACSESTNPLVLIFFSGHGARDSENRHYLVPHDGVRNDLFATALWSRTFESALRLFDNTSRLVVFLDACHAAGIDGDGEKGAQACDPSTLLKEQPGRYLVASCLAHQVSQERDGHGIFSDQLLRLMRCENEEDSEGEVVELFGLYAELRKRVMQVAGDQQEPWSSVQEPTRDIILAINQARRKARERRELALLEAVNRELRDRKHKQSEVLRFRLLKFITGPFVEDPKPLELYFRQCASKLNGAPPNLELVYEVCDALDYYLADKERGGGLTYYARAASARPEPTRPQAAIRPTVPSRSPTRPDQDASERLPAERPSTPIGLPTSAGSPDRRCLPSDDVSYLLENIREQATKAKYSGRITRLKQVLMQPDGMSEKEFITVQRSTCGDGDKLWADLIDDLGARFESRWRNAFKPGAWACSRSDLVDLSLIAGRLRQPDRSIDEFLAGRFPPEANEALAEYQGEGPDRSLEDALACCLNTIIHGPSIWEEGRFDGIELRQETAHIRAQNPQGGANLEQLNRMLLEDAYPDGLRKQSVADPLSLRRGRASGDQRGSDA